MFFLISSMASGFLSIAYTLDSQAFLAISIVTEPVPAPMSYTMSEGLMPSFATDIQRISSLVIGTFALSKSLSLSIWDESAALGFSISMTARFSNSVSAISAALPDTSLSSSLPRFSPTVTVTYPRPASASSLHMLCTFCSPPVSANTFLL